MIGYKEAMNLISEHIGVLKTEKRPIENALGYVLAESIDAKEDIPNFNKSAMDGYALHQEGYEFSTFEIVGESKAGTPYLGELPLGKAVKIMTGAPVPKGADSVIQLERVDIFERWIEIREGISVGGNIIPKGDELKAGELAIEKGTRLKPSTIGVLATLGVPEVLVYGKPRVSLVITGDELVAVDAPLAYGMIRNSNQYVLEAALREMGVSVFCEGILNDDPQTIENAMKRAFEQGDVVLTSGGASVGDYDFVQRAFKALNGTLIFEKVAIKPGKPIQFGWCQEKPFFALPGNPTALLTTFEELVKPALLKMSGDESNQTDTFKVMARSFFREKAGRTKFIYCHLKEEAGQWCAYEVGSQCSNHLMTISKANGVLILPENKGHIHVGEMVDAKFICR